MLDLNDIRDAAQQIDGVAHRTPVLTSRTLDEVVGGTVYLKAENLQRTGSFKFRGAYNRISRLTPVELAAGVITISSGNHAQAVALAAKLVGTTAVILMPEDAPAVKRDAVEGYGAEILTFDRYATERDNAVAEVLGDRGGTFVPPYDHPLIMAGQGTAALELIADVGELDVLIAPVSGGGLIAGCGTAAKALHPGLRLIGVEPETANDTQLSLAAGERTQIPVPRTIADGLQVAVPGALTFEINRRNIDEVVTVTDAEIIDAMRFLFDRTKTVVEPSGAVAVAALLQSRVDVRNKRVGVILSGGNVGAERWGELIATQSAR